MISILIRIRILVCLYDMYIYETYMRYECIHMIFTNLYMLLYVYINHIRCVYIHV